MAKEPRPKQQTEQLKAEIARSRDLIARDVRGLRYELDIPRKIRRSFRDHTALWIGAAVVVGTLIVLLPMRKKKVYVDARVGGKSKEKKVAEAGLALAAAKIAASVLKPIVVKFITTKMANHAAGTHSARKW